jgi:hypothetical protein
MPQLLLLWTSVLQPYSYGLSYNTVTKSIDNSHVYTSGRYFLGLAHAFFIFPRGWTTIYFGTADGGESRNLVIFVAASAWSLSSLACRRQLRTARYHASVGNDFCRGLISVLTSAVRVCGMLNAAALYAQPNRL